MFGNFKRKYKNKILKNIVSYVQINYKKINKDDMKLGDSYFNRKCHLNSVQYVKKGLADEVYLSIYIDDGWPIVHFINKVEDKYVDNTLGWQYELIDYYIIRKIDPSEYYDIADILDNTQSKLIEDNSNSFLRYIFNISKNGLI